MTFMRVEGVKFPQLKESDAMFAAQVPPEWEDSDCCHLCRTQFTTFNRKVGSKAVMSELDHSRCKRATFTHFVVIRFAASLPEVRPSFLRQVLESVVRAAETGH